MHTGRFRRLSAFICFIALPASAQRVLTPVYGLACPAPRVVPLATPASFFASAIALSAPSPAVGLKPVAPQAAVPAPAPTIPVVAHSEKAGQLLRIMRRVGDELAEDERPTPPVPVAPRQRGEVKRWNEARGYGFIAPEEDGESVYFVANEVRGPYASDPLYKPLREGDGVDFDVEKRPDGLRAVRIVRRGNK